MCTDRDAIEELLYEYAECVDLARFKELGELFRYGQLRADRGEAGVLGSPAAVEEFYRRTNRVHGDGTLRTRHQVTNVRISIDDDGERAGAKSYFVVLQATDVLPLQPIVAGRYEDRVRKIGGSWWFADRLIHVDQIGNMGQHLDFELS